MEILKQNQNIADTRAEDVIQKEALDQQVDELERKAEEAKQEVVASEMATSPSKVQLTTTNEDVEMRG